MVHSKTLAIGCGEDCGLKAEKVLQLPGKAPFSKRFEEAVGLACESDAVRRVARQFGMAESTVRGIDTAICGAGQPGGRRSAKTHSRPACVLSA